MHVFVRVRKRACVCVSIVYSGIIYAFSMEFYLQFMGGHDVKQKIKGVYVHGNVGELIMIYTRFCYSGHSQLVSFTYRLMNVLKNHCDAIVHL